MLIGVVVSVLLFVAALMVRHAQPSCSGNTTDPSPSLVPHGTWAPVSTSRGRVRPSLPRPSKLLRPTPRLWATSSCSRLVYIFLSELPAQSIHSGPASASRFLQICPWALFCLTSRYAQLSRSPQLELYNPFRQWVGVANDSPRFAPIPNDNASWACRPPLLDLVPWLLTLPLVMDSPVNE
jgi:hypothetical protein